MGATTKAEGIVTNDKKERIPQAKVYIYDQNNTLLKSLTTDEKAVSLLKA